MEIPELRYRIVTLYWGNINPRLVKAQARVFSHLGLPLEQHLKSGLDHGQFLQETMESLADDEVMLCVDIDCLPLNAEIVRRALLFAKRGGLIGTAQVSEHIDKTRLFTSPVFMAVSKKLWCDLGKPSFLADKVSDVAQHVHDAAQAAGVNIEYLTPFACLVPRWSLPDQTPYGTGTFYRGGLFHLYESRVSPFTFAFHVVAADVVAGRKTDIVALCRRAMLRYPASFILAKWNRARRMRKLRLWFSGLTVKKAP